jgi:hypothetical protein
MSINNIRGILNEVLRLVFPGILVFLSIEGRQKSLDDLFKEIISGDLFKTGIGIFVILTGPFVYIFDRFIFFDIVGRLLRCCLQRWIKCGEQEAGGICKFLPIRFSHNYIDETFRSYLLNRWSWVHTITATYLIAFTFAVYPEPKQGSFFQEFKTHVIVGSIILFLVSFYQATILWGTEREALILSRERQAARERRRVAERTAAGL